MDELPTFDGEDMMPIDEHDASAATWTGPAILDVSPAVYHADPCPAPSLSSSLAKVLLDQSAAHARARHPRLGGSWGSSTAEQTAGTLIHAVLLDTLDDIVRVDAKNWRKKSDQALRNAAHAAGKTAVLEREYADAIAAADVIRAKLAAEGVRLDGASELPIAWPVETVAGPIWCRALLDHVHLDAGVIYDLKSSRSAHPRACPSHVLEYGYEIQRAAYIEAVEQLRPELAGRVRFELLFVELEPPYAITIGDVDGVIASEGEDRWRAAQTLWAKALHEDRWETWPARQRIEAPRWLLAKRMEA